MLINLLSQNNYVQFNITLANTIGLHSAIYLSELMDINDKAVRKNCLVDNTFVIDRQYVKSRTTLSEDEQKKIDSELSAIGVLKVDKKNKDKVEIDINMLVSIMSSENEHIMDDVEKIVKSKAKSTKSSKTDKTAFFANAAKNAVVTINEELQTAYYNWIDSVISKTGWISAKTVTEAQDTIDNYTHRNLDVALAILSIAESNGYRDIIWAIQIYEQYCKMRCSSNMSVAQGTTTRDSVSEVSF